MSAIKVVELVETIAERAEHMRGEIVEERVERIPLREIQSLRRALDTLEQELLEPLNAARSDAC